MASTKSNHENCPKSHGLVRLRRKLNNRFYEPIVLLITLNRVWGDHQKSKAPDLSIEVVQSPEHDFQCFVNKLGQICDTECGGKTVTAFVVLKFPDHIEYRFASNLRAEKDLISVQSFVEHLLHTLHKADDFKPSELISHILRRLLSFIRPRIGAYVKSLKTNTALCISTCEMEGTVASEFILKELKKLQELLNFPHEKTVDDNSFSKHCETLLYDIDRVYQSEMNEHMRNRSNEGKINESKCWCELRHAATRLVSYLHATKCLISTRKRLPELFESFKVCYIKSSLPAECPLKTRSRASRLSMKAIIGRMTSDPTALERYRGYAQHLEKLEVDENIQEEAWDNTLRPIVHAEVLVLDSLLKDGGTSSSKFFGGYKYIGCSKPTCRLCDYYFSFHPSGVEVRHTHRNLYPNWRMPDVYKHEGPGAVKDTEDLMIKILGRVKEDAFRTLIEKVPESKHHDSNTEPTYRIDGISTRGIGESDPLANLFPDLDIGRSGDDSMSISSTKGSYDALYPLAAESDYEEEEEGGAKL